MKRYRTITRDTCWPDCIACMLEVRPGRVPNFVKEYGGRYMDMTREWLKENFRKGIVYIPSKHFMETGVLRQNGPIGPGGYSIAHLGMVDGRNCHVVIAFNGGVLWDNGDNRSHEYDTILGYFVIYDLEPPKVKWIKKSKKKI